LRAVLLAASVALALGTAISGCLSPLVGGDCKEGHSVCGSRCIDLRSDPQNCGQCGQVCTGICAQGMCVGNPDGQVSDGRPGLDASSDARPLRDAGDFRDVDGSGGGDDAGTGGGDAGGGGPGDAGTGSGDGGGPSDASIPDAQSCPLGEKFCAGQCVDPETDRNHCGDCGNQCQIDHVCSAGTCSPVCEAPTSACGPICVDRSNDPDHCGTCDNVCSSGLCAGGTCQGALPGHIVVIGHDYTTTLSGMNRLVGNAVFLPRIATPRVLVYEGDATSAAVQGANGAINQVAAELGRTWTRTAVTANDVSFQLANHDAFLIYNQENSTDGELAALGTLWQTALGQFLARGGVVVLLDGAGAHSGTYQILNQAGLLDITGRTDITGSSLMVVDPGDAVATGVPSPYSAEMSSVRFAGTSADVVVSDGTGPVVIHRLR
jgi:hypothetical protein